MTCGQHSTSYIVVRVNLADPNISHLYFKFSCDV